MTHVEVINGDNDLKPVCNKCQWEGPVVRNEVIAQELLKRHKETRKHKVNSRSPHRFTV